MIRPGEVYWADHQTATPHPVVVAARDGERMRDLIKAVGHVIGSDCEPE